MASQEKIISDFPQSSTWKKGVPFFLVACWFQLFLPTVSPVTQSFEILLPSTKPIQQTSFGSKFPCSVIQSGSSGQSGPAFRNFQCNQREASSGKAFNGASLQFAYLYSLPFTCICGCLLLNCHVLLQMCLFFLPGVERIFPYSHSSFTGRENTLSFN